MTREELYVLAEAYLDALEAKDPARLPWADDAKFTENNVRLEPGDGLWQTISARRRTYDLKAADPESGQVAWFGLVEEHGHSAIMGLRLGLVDGRIAEVETIVCRSMEFGPFPSIETYVSPRPLMLADVPAAQRVPRERMIAIANGYFETIERNNGMIRTRFHAHCNRVENGVQTTNSQDFPLPIARLGCEAQFALGWYRYDDELRARRFPLVDVERGIVLAHGFIDHSGRLGEYELTDGTQVSSPIRRPHSYYLAEAFKIRDGAIEQVEAVFHTVPYRMPSPWEGHQ